MVGWVNLLHLKSLRTAIRRWTGAVLGVLVLASTVCLLGACSGQSRAGKSAPPVSGQAVLATFNGGQVTVEEAAKWFLLFDNPQRIPADDSNETEWVRQAVNQRIIEKMVSEKARQAGLDQRESIQQMRQEYIDRAIARLYFLRHILEPIRVRESDIQRYYREHQSDFRQPETFSFKMIYFDPQKDGREKAQRRALRVLDRLKQGAIFEALIEENSDVDEVTRTKDFGPYTTDGGLLPEIQEAAAKLKVGEVSDLISHKKGFHIIKLTQRTEAYQPPLEEVQDRIRALLFEKQKQMAEAQLVQAHREALGIEENYHIIGLPLSATNDVVLKVGEQVMTYGDYLDLARQRQYANEQDFRAEFQKRFLQMVYQALARRQGYDQAPEVQECVEFQMDRQLTFEYLEENIDSQVQISEEQIRELYESNKSLFYDPRKVYARQIFFPIKTRPDMARYELVREIHNAEAQANQVLLELSQGLSFEQAARLYSAAPNAESGGLLGWVSHGSSVRFDMAAFRLEEGEITPKPVAAKTGYQLIKVEKKAPAQLRSLDEVREMIRDRLHRTESDRRREEYLKELVQAAGIEMEPSLARMFGQYLRYLGEQKSLFTLVN